MRKKAPQSKKIKTSNSSNLPKIVWSAKVKHDGVAMNAMFRAMMRKKASQSSSRRTGFISDWKPQKGFGFIQADHGREVFCHRTQVVLSNQSDRSPLVGSRVEFELGEMNRAQNVSAIGGSAVPSGRYEGIVKKWDPKHDCGIITAMDGKGDISFSEKDIWQQKKEFDIGIAVEYDLKLLYGTWHANYVTKKGKAVKFCKKCGSFDHFETDSFCRLFVRKEKAEVVRGESAQGKSFGWRPYTGKV